MKYLKEKTLLSAVLISFGLLSCQQNEKTEEKNEKVYADGHTDEDHAKMEGGDHAHAGENHAHKAPHGGKVITADNYHIEMTKDDNELRFYVLDANEKTLKNSAISGKAMIQAANGTTTTIPLQKKGNEIFQVNTDKIDINSVVVTFTVDGKTISGQF